jgi:hypothetical protein
MSKYLKVTYGPNANTYGPGPNTYGPYSGITTTTTATTVPWPQTSPYYQPMNPIVVPQSVEPDPLLEAAVLQAAADAMVGKKLTDNETRAVGEALIAMHRQMMILRELLQSQVKLIENFRLIK